MSFTFSPNEFRTIFWLCPGKCLERTLLCNPVLWNIIFGERMPFHLTSVLRFLIHVLYFSVIWINDKIKIRYYHFSKIKKMSSIYQTILHYHLSYGKKKIINKVQLGPTYLFEKVRYVHTPSGWTYFTFFQTYWFFWVENEEDYDKFALLLILFFSNTKFKWVMLWDKQIETPENKLWSSIYFWTKHFKS